MNAPNNQFDPFQISTSFFRLAQSWSTDYEGLSAGLMKLATEINRGFLDELGRTMKSPSPLSQDSKELTDYQAAACDTAHRNSRVLREYHHAWLKWVTEYVDQAPGLDSEDRDRCRFWAEQVAAALAPANFFWANVGAVKHFFATKGESLEHGYANWLQDQKESHGMVPIADRESFEVGKDLAVTPGAVVHRNGLMELIQYAPTTETVHAVPVVFVQPWINKYYILDLSPQKSLMAWLRDQGFTVFTVSWKNPDPSMRDVGFEDYVFDGALEAINTAREITGADAVHAVGFCIGGTALSALMAWLSSKAVEGQDKSPASPVGHWTLLASLADFSHPGDLGLFTGEEPLRFTEALMDRDGFLDGNVVGTVFRLLRSDNLIWHHAVRHYLYGDAPMKSDVLYWNSDSTRLPKRMLSFYLREFYINNSLVSDEGLLLNGRRLHLSDIKPPLYSVACIQDHIVPWTESYRTREYLTCPVRFALSSEGHVAGIVNPPSAKSRRRYWVADIERDMPPDEWLAAREPQQGSWWTDWGKWLHDHCGPQVAPRVLGSAEHPPICAAPGTYVFE